MKAILFDLDGVLMNSTPVHRRAFRQALGEIGLRFHDYRLVAGMRTVEAMQRLLKKARRRLPKDQLARLVARKQALAHQFLRDKLPIRHHSLPVLRRLGRRFQLALVSSTSRKNVDLFLKTTGTRRLFAIVLSAEDVTKAKPDPALYRKALRRLQREASESLVVEDAVAGVQAARRLGIRTLALTGTTQPSNLIGAGAEKVFRNLRTLATYVEHL